MTTRFHTYTKETDTMKKTLFVMVVATALVFAFSAVAMAKVTNGYAAWDEAYNNGVLGTANTSPHSAYTVATDKCAVCHAVHNAPVSGTQWTGTDPWTAGTDETQMLLRSSVANACTFCHITTNVGGKQIYNGTAALYDQKSVASFTENVAHNTNSASCVGCHAVHGANTFKGAATPKILKLPMSGGVYTPAKFQDEVFGATGLYADAATAIADGASKDNQVTVFCTQCHQNFSAASETTLNADGDYVYGDATYIDGDPTANKQYKSHPMKAADAAFSAAGATFTGTVAWKGSQTCRTCHDAGVVDAAPGLVPSSYPHYTPGAYNFVNVAANAGAAAVAGNINMATDGMCLKCHDQDATIGSGVGENF